MAYCSNCGSGLDSGAKFCPVCGKALETSANKKASGSGELKKAFMKLISSQEHTDEFETRDIEENKAFALLSYIGILFLIPIIAAPKSRFARYHANQGLLLFLIGVIINMATGFIFEIFDFFDFLTILSITLIPVHIISAIPIILAIYGIYNAVTGKAKDLPIIGKIRILQ